MYARFFHDRLEFAADALCREAPAETGPVVAGPALMSGAALDPLLGQYAAARGLVDRRAAATDWSKFFFARLIIPVTVIQCASGRRLDLDPAHWRVQCRDDGTIAHFIFDRDPLGLPAPGDVSSLVDAVMTPLTAALVADCRLAPRVFASNAAMYYAWALDQLAQQGRIAAADLAPAQALLAQANRPDGGHNPFHVPFKPLAAGAHDGNGEPTTECRRLCCVRDLDPSLGLCANCPRAISYPAHPGPDPRDDTGVPSAERVS